MINTKLVLLEIPYLDLQLKKQIGRLEVDADLSEEVIAIFQELFAAGFPIAQMLPFHHFNNDDNFSMRSNNCYGYGYREAVNKPGVLSWHSYGRAIDVNPLYNPYIKGNMILPEEGKEYLDRSKKVAGMLHEDSVCVVAFEKRGWTWGGRWTDRIDYHHFEKPF